MFFLDGIEEWLAVARDWFNEAYLEVKDWIVPFNYLADPLHWIYIAFTWLTELFGDFNDWVDDAASKIGEILSEVDIWSLFSVPIEWAQNAWEWVSNAWNNVWSEVESWWSSMVATVTGWIDAAVEGLSDLRVAWDSFWTVTWPEWTGNFSWLQAAWDGFVTSTLPSLVGISWIWDWWSDRLLDIGGLIDSTLRVWFPMYDTFREIWDEIEAFFADPVEYVFNKLDDFFEREW